MLYTDICQLISLCRSLSHADLDTPNFETAAAAEEPPLENVPVIEPAAVASDAESEAAQEKAAEGDNEPLVEPGMGIQDPMVDAELPALEEGEMMQSEVRIREVHGIGGCTSMVELSIF